MQHETSVTFQTEDPILQRVYDTAEEKTRLNLKLFGRDPVLVEGGGTIHFSMLSAGLVDKIFAFIAPKIIGGANALTAVEGAGFEKLSDVVRLKHLTTEKLGKDILISGYTEA